MHKYSTMIIKALCTILAVLILWQLLFFIRHSRPWTNWKTPAIRTPMEPSQAKADKGSVQSSNPAPPIQQSDISPALKIRIDRVIKSEIFGMIPKPLPMALLGIAGQDAMLRTPNGQTGLIQEGGELGGIKLLKIGANRVLVEENGVQKELTIFSGLGSESLMPKGKENIP